MKIRATNKVKLMANWLLKSDPETYSFDDLERDRQTRWDGVENAQALIYIRQMKKGDHALIYHSGKDKCIVGLAVITSTPYPDPALSNDKLVVVDIEFAGRAPQPVALSRIKQEKDFAEFLLVRHSRLSVMPVPAALWKKLLAWAGLKG
jgi:predicted RNA-binding protein with PUA-like domain